jgi:hypothetical protein
MRLAVGAAADHGSSSKVTLHHFACFAILSVKRYASHIAVVVQVMHHCSIPLVACVLGLGCMPPANACMRGGIRLLNNLNPNVPTSVAESESQHRRAW